MKKQILHKGLFWSLLGMFACETKTADTTLQTQTNTRKMEVTIDTLKQILDAFNRHDLDAIMEYFTDDIYAQQFFFFKRNQCVRRELI